MSKKDYQAIAAVIYEATHDGYEHCNLIRSVPCGWHTKDCHVHYGPADRIQERLTDLLARGNPRFDRARFIEACETGKCKGMRARP